MPQWKLIWITEFKNLDEVRRKLGSKYGIDVDELKANSVCNKNLRGYGDFSYKRGLRTVIHFQINSGKTIRAVIRIVDKQNDIWIIKTASYI